jgi:phospholipid/cholesterol/gamma-HCH transport system ATP-binding protein
MKEVLPYKEDSSCIISISGLKKSFGETLVLNGIDLCVKKGENIVVLGRSGSGKSVLIKLMVGLLKQDEGSISILGQVVENASEKEMNALRLKIGFLFQGGALYDSMTVKENLAFSFVRNRKIHKGTLVDNAIAEALDDVGLIQTMHQMPAALSGGQKKRIGIARMLILKPEIILYDEPTAGLDPITSVEINNLINKVKKQYDTTSLIITHDLSCAKFTGDRILMLNEGTFIKEGSFDQVFDTTDPRIRDFYNYNFIKTT